MSRARRDDHRRGREPTGRRRLVGHQAAHVVGVGRHQRERVDGAAAAREQVHRARAERRDHPVEVFRVLLGGTGVVSVGLRPEPRGS